LTQHPDATVRSQLQLPRNTRAHLWRDVPDAAWNDWQWQLKNRLNTIGELAQVIHLTPEEEEGIRANGIFRVDITPYFASLIDPDDPTCPIRRQVVPTGRELVPFEAEMADSLAEDRHSPVPGLVHRYPDRVLMLITTQCASYCRFCTRSRIVGDPHQNFSPEEFEAQLDYLRRTPQVRDVLLSGGDPLVMSPKVLEGVLRELRKIEHIEVIRIGSRVPIFMPQRVTGELCEMLAQFHPLWMNVHVNHPKEITPEVADAFDRLSRAGIPLGSQTVLLRGVNDHPVVMQKLMRELVRVRVRPYYIYQCDEVHGAGHFRTSVAQGIEIMESLRGHMSGYAVPTFVVDLPGGGGKVPVGPNYVISQGPGRIVLRNFEGYIGTYTEPSDYAGPDMAIPPEWVRQEPGQRGVSGLLSGEALAISPQGFDDVHQRGGEPHRLNRDPVKWQPRGIGVE
jgi:lysine 2,3-aminomutase